MSRVIFWADESREKFKYRDPKVTKRDFWITVVITLGGPFTTRNRVRLVLVNTNYITYFFYFCNDYHI
jgi:hypothetical protein